MAREREQVAGSEAEQRTASLAERGNAGNCSLWTDIIKTRRYAFLLAFNVFNPDRFVKVFLF